MTGFTKKSVPNEIAVPINFEIHQNNPDDGSDPFVVTAAVTHYFKRPSPGARERLADSMTNPRGRTRSPRRMLEETYKFWVQNIIRVEGYDDMPEFLKTQSDFKIYFRDDIGMEHVQASVVLLLSMVGGEEGEILKKSDSSQESSSEQDRALTKTPISATR